MKSKATKLTATAAKAIKAGQRPLYDSQVIGLQLKPVGDGKGKWILRFVSPETSKRRDMGLGTFPETPIVKARELAIGARQQISSGLDPIEVRRNEKSERSSSTTPWSFQKAAEARFEVISKGFKNPKHRDQWINTLRTYVFPEIGSRQVGTLTPRDFADVLNPIWLEKPETASRIKQRCSDVMKWCWAQELVSSNPLDVVGNLLPSQTQSPEHFPAMAWRDIPAFIQDVVCRERDITRIVLEFLILTAGRSGEVRGATWTEIDLKNEIWTISADRMKAGKEQRVPLSARAMELLREVEGRHDHLVFPSPRGKILTDMALTSFLRHHEAPSTTTGRTAVAHGFRSSFKDWASENGYPRDYSERALAHTIRDKTEGAYHRTDLLDQRREMMEKWADFITGNIAEEG